MADSTYKVSWGVNPTGTIIVNDPEEEIYISKNGHNGIENLQLIEGKFDTRYYSSFSGADIIATIIMPGISEPVNFAQLRAISYSLVRDKRPLRILGSVNPICWSKSSRLIAGTIVFASFDRYVWFQITGDAMGSKGILLADMLPPFDIVITAINEYGLTSRLCIRGARIVDEGATMGTDDMFLEQVHTFVAQDIVPWVPNTVTDDESGSL